MALIFEPFTEPKLVFGCAQELWDLLGMLMALDVLMLSHRLSAISNEVGRWSHRDQGSFTSYKTSSTFTWIGVWSVQLGASVMKER